MSPFYVLRGADKALLYFRVLFPHGLLTMSFRAGLEWHLGNFDRAISSLEALISFLEEAPKHRMGSKSYRLVIANYYSMVARAYLQRGHVDDAMLVIIRASNSLGIQRLRGLSELDAKTAHIVRAGISAGRLLDHGNLATMMVRSTQDKNKVPRSRKSMKNRRNNKKNIRGASKNKELKSKEKSKDHYCLEEDPNVLNFPQQPQG